MRKACVKCGDDEDQEDMVSCVECEAGPWHFGCLEGASARDQDNYKCRKCAPGEKAFLEARMSVFLPGLQSHMLHV